MINLHFIHLHNLGSAVFLYETKLYTSALRAIKEHRRKLHNEKLHNWCCEQNIVMANKSRMMRWEAYVERMVRFLLMQIALVPRNCKCQPETTFRI
jgi:hypothetical protein